MKYIRTKDGIYKVAYIDVENDIWCIAKNNEIKLLPELKQEANTIEELCDVEVIVWKDSAPSTWNKFLTKQEFEHLYSNFQRKKIIAVYGAIWTDKGLIFVARMNNEGVLELL